MRNQTGRCDWFTTERERICLSPYCMATAGHGVVAKEEHWRVHPMKVHPEGTEEEREMTWRISMNISEWRRRVWYLKEWMTHFCMKNDDRNRTSTKRKRNNSYHWRICVRFNESHHTKRTLQRKFWHRNIHNLHIWIRYKQLPVDWRSKQRSASWCNRRMVRYITPQYDNNLLFTYIHYLSTLPDAWYEL